MLSFLLTAIIMFGFWFSLSGQTKPIFLIIGAVCSLLVAFWSHDLLIGKKEKGPYLKRTLRMLLYLPWLAWQIVLSNVHLVYLVLHPKMPIDPTLIRFKHNIRTNMGITLLANSITLTPGTITIEADRDEYIVHAISRKTAEDLLAGVMQAKVKEIEGEVRS